jgi:peptide/nickel transport system permease protein
MEENKTLPEVEAMASEEVSEVSIKSADTEAPLDKNLRLMSPTRMVVRRFFRSKLSIIGLVMVISLFIFSFLGPVLYNTWGEI